MTNATAALAPVQLDYADFRKRHPAVRCYMHHTSETRAMHAASHRLGHKQRQASGEVFYVHPMVPDRAFSTAKAATMHAFEVAKGGI